MFKELYPVARHTSLNILITPRGDKLSVIIIPKPDENEVDEDSALRKPISMVGTPDELDAEFGAALTQYATKVNGLRTAIDLPIEALDAEIGKAEKKVEKKAAPKPAPKKTAKPKPIKRAAPATPKAAKRPPAKSPVAKQKQTPIARSSKPGKPECLADLIKLQATHGDKLTRRLFIDNAATGRRYEKLWPNWDAFIAAGKRAATKEGATNQNSSQTANHDPQSADTASDDKSATAAPATPKPIIRTVYTDKGMLLGSTAKPVDLGGTYKHEEFGDYRVVEFTDEKIIVQRQPEEPAAGDTQTGDLLAASGGA